MHLWRLPALVLTVVFGSIISATPIAEPQLLPRNHVECSSTTHLCHVQQTCDNAPSIAAGTVPDPWPSSVAEMVNPVSGLEPLANSTSADSTSRRRLSRQPSAALWCALGTQVYIVLALQGTQGAAVVMSMLQNAIHEVETQMAKQTVNTSTTGIAAGSAPVYSISGTNSEITANNAAGVNMTWQELELGLLMIADWMGKNTYGWGSASVWNGTDEVGLIYITE